METERCAQEIQRRHKQPLPHRTVPQETNGRAMAGAQAGSIRHRPGGEVRIPSRRLAPTSVSVYLLPFGDRSITSHRTRRARYGGVLRSIDPASCEMKRLGYGESVISGRQPASKARWESTYARATPDRRDVRRGDGTAKKLSPLLPLWPIPVAGQWTRSASSAPSLSQYLTMTRREAGHDRAA